VGNWEIEKWGGKWNKKYENCYNNTEILTFMFIYSQKNIILVILTIYTYIMLIFGYYYFLQLLCCNLNEIMNGRMQNTFLYALAF
jgi:hypothetical protein